MIQADEDRIQRFCQLFSSLEEEVGRVIVGNREIVRKVLTAFFAGGHVLLESAPGLGKTLLMKSLSRAVSLGAKRIQFTPDLMPSDIVGTEVLSENHAERSFTFKPGPVFTHIVLADEVNRATPKTQSAILEAHRQASDSRMIPPSGTRRWFARSVPPLATMSTTSSASPASGAASVGPRLGTSSKGALHRSVRNRLASRRKPVAILRRRP